MDTLQLIHSAAQAISEKKGFNLLVLDVRGELAFTDYFLIAEGFVDRHLVAMKQAIEEEMSKRGVEPWGIDGAQSADWIVLDYGDFMVHLFRQGVREQYSLERLWSEGNIVELEQEIGQGNDEQTG